MASATMNEVKQPAAKAAVVPLKIAWFGEQGTGKTTSAALTAAALSREFHGGAPVWVTDPELGWQFPKRRIFTPEKIELIQRTTPTFKAMVQDMRDAERAGACVWAVELGKIWLELLKSCHKNAGNNWGQELSKMWNDYINLFLNSGMHCMGLGRVSDITEDLVDEQGKITKLKTGEKMKAGGSNNFGYEPHLVLRMTLEQKPRRKGGELQEGEGRMLHCARVLKDRTWAVNGMTFRWSDKAGYKPGDYRTVWQSLRPHFLEAQATMGHVTLDTAATSDEMFNDGGKSQWYADKERLEVLRGEFHASIELLWGGTSNDAKRMRIMVFEHIYGFKSKEAVEAASLQTIERGVRIMQAFEKKAKIDKSILAGGEATILAELDKNIQAYDSGEADVEDLPF